VLFSAGRAGTRTYEQLLRTGKQTIRAGKHLMRTGKLVKCHTSAGRESTGKHASRKRALHLRRTPASGMDRRRPSGTTGGPGRPESPRSIPRLRGQPIGFLSARKLQHSLPSVHGLHPTLQGTVVTICNVKISLLCPHSHSYYSQNEQGHSLYRIGCLPSAIEM
jgi:hypothetical protein